MYWDTVIWFGLMVAFLVMEANTVSLVTLWFAVGALAALAASLLGGALWLQIVLFFVISLVLLAALAPFVRKVLKPRVTSTNVDAVVGTRGYVTEEVDNLIPTGRVKLGGMSWSARSQSGQAIPKDTEVEVVRIEGVKAFVKPIQ